MKTCCVIDMYLYWLKDVIIGLTFIGFLAVVDKFYNQDEEDEEQYNCR